MKFDVDKFKKDTNYSGRYSDWDSNLQKMNKMLDEKPIREGSKHYWQLRFSCHKWVKIGFDDQGNIFCEYSGRPHKNEKVNVVNEAQIKFITETFLKFLSVFDEFGYILHSANTRIDESEVQEDESTL